MSGFKILDRNIDENSPVYFIADIAANHDGDLSRAKDLISMAKEKGADAVKFQHFRAKKIVSDYGFTHMKSKLSHQSKWKKSVVEVYDDASLDWTWTEELYKHCINEDIHFFSSPYDFEVVDMLDKFVPAYKVGSGDINWNEILVHIAKKNKPVIIATGATSLNEVIVARDAILPFNSQLAILQCNTNYTGSLENFKYISLNVLKSYRQLFPESVIGLSDHTPGHATVLGAVALGAKIIEKHLTDDNKRKGPDHPFSMNPQSWKDMVDRTRELEYSLGSTIKRVEDNEKDTVIVQRRCLRASRDIKAGEVIKRSDIEVLRPATSGAYSPNDIEKIIGKKLNIDMVYGQDFRPEGVC